LSQKDFSELDIYGVIRTGVMRQVLVFSKLNKTCPRGRLRQRWLDWVKGYLNQVEETAKMKDADNRR